MSTLTPSRTAQIERMVRSILEQQVGKNGRAIPASAAATATSPIWSSTSRPGMPTSRRRTSTSCSARATSSPR